MARTVTLETAGETCRHIYQVVVDPERELNQAFAAKHSLRYYFFMNAAQINSHLTGIARRVRSDVRKLREDGDHATADAVERRLQLVHG